MNEPLKDFLEELRRHAIGSAVDAVIIACCLTIVYVALRLAFGGGA